jgi:hypothetical protein
MLLSDPSVLKVSLVSVCLLVLTLSYRTLYLHYELLRFCQVTRLQYINFLLLGNRCVSSPLVILRNIHCHLIANCECKDTYPPQSQPVERACVGLSQQDGDAQQEETDPLLPQLSWIHKAYHVWGEDTSNIPNIPPQHRVTMQILKHLRLRSHTVLSSSSSVHSSALLPPLRTLSFGQRWTT